MSDHEHQDHHDEFEDTHVASPDDDEWFVHSPEEPHAQAAHGRVNSSVIGGVLLLTVLGTFGVIAIFMGYVPRVIDSMRIDRQEQSDKLVNELTDASDQWSDQLTITDPAWQPRLLGEPGEGPRLRIPWESAQEAVIERYANGE